MTDFSQLVKVTQETVIVYILLIVLCRFIGKKLIAELTLADFVMGITIGTIAGAFVTDEIKGYYLLYSVVVFAVLVILSGFLTLKSSAARNLIEGKPLIVIQEGKINEKNMEKARYHLDSLLMQLRGKGIFDLQEVENAILEPHGQLSVQKKAGNQPATVKDLKGPVPLKGLAAGLVKDGIIMEENLRQHHLSYEWLFNELSAQGVFRLDQVFFAELSPEGKLYIDLKEDNTET